MAGKNVGMTLFGVVVAIGAFVTSNIWATNLRDRGERLTHATEAWDAAYNTVSDKEIDFKGSMPSDLTAASTRLKHRIGDAHQLEDATLPLVQAGVGTLTEDEASIHITQRLGTIEEQASSVDSVDRAAALDSETAGLISQLKGQGVLWDSEALKVMDRSEANETHVKYAGYSLSILGIIIAAIAQLTGKGAD